MTITQTFDPAATVIRNQTRFDSDESLNVSVALYGVLIATGSTEPVTVEDAVIDRNTSSTVDQSGRVIVSNSQSNPVFESLTPLIGTVDADGVVTRVSDGNARIAFSVDSVSFEASVPCKRLASTTIDVFNSWVDGSLGEELANAIDSRLVGQSPSTDRAVFSMQDHNSATYVRNVACWAYDIDLTCVSPWNNAGGAQRAGTAITSRHFLNAAHFELSLGNTIRFVTENNIVVSRTITGKARHPDYSPYYPDLTVYTLDSALPETITPCKILPPDWQNYLKQIQKGRPPAICFDQEEKALVSDLFQFSNYAVFITPTNSQRLAFSESIIGGDSGNPAFFVINDELVLLTVWTGGGAGAGTFVTPQISALNAMIATADAQAGVSTGLEVTTIDLSTFTDFS